MKKKKKEKKILKVSDGEQRQLVDNIFKHSSISSSTVPLFCGDCVVSNKR